MCSDKSLGLRTTFRWEMTTKKWIEIVHHCYVSEMLILQGFLHSPPTSHHRSPLMSFSKEYSLWGPDSFQLQFFMWKRPEIVCLTKSRAETFLMDLSLGPLGVQLWWLHTIALLVSSYFGCLGMFTQQETNPPNSLFSHFGLLIRFN